MRVERVHVEIVVADGHIGHNFQIRRARQFVLADPFARGERAIAIRETAREFVRGEHVAQVHVDIEILLEAGALDHVGKRGTRDEYFLLHLIGHSWKNNKPTTTKNGNRTAHDQPR